jgi:hypothetical protein
MKTLAFGILLISFHSLSYDVVSFLKNPPSLKTWKRVNNSYYEISSYERRKRLNLLKQMVIKDCKKQKCSDHEPVLYAYLYYKDVLKKNERKLYLKNLLELTQLQQNYLTKCGGDIECKAESLNSFCLNYEQHSEYPAIFCISNYLVSGL